MDNIREYWLKNLKLISATGNIHLFNGERMEHPIQFQHRLASSTADKVLSLCRNNDLSVYIYLVTAYGILLNKYTDARHLSIGTALFHKGLNSGPDGYEGLLPLVVPINKEDSFKQQLVESRQAVLAAVKNQHHPFHKLYSESGITSAADMFDTFIICRSLGDEDRHENTDAPFVIELNIQEGQIILTLTQSVKTS